MPLLTFDLIEGRTEQEVKTLLDAAHRAVLRAFEVPERDRYQIVHENKAHHMVIEDTGLGLTRTRDLVVVRVYTSPRSEAQKQRFFAILQEELAEHCGLSGDDLDVGTQESHILHAGLKRFGSSRPHTGAFDIYRDKILIGKHPPQSDGIFATSATQFEYNRVIVLEKLFVPFSLHVKRHIVHCRVRILKDMRITCHIGKLL